MNTKTTSQNGKMSSWASNLLAGGWKSNRQGRTFLAGLMFFSVMLADMANAQNLLLNGGFNLPTIGSVTNGSTITGVAPTNWTTWTFATTAGNAWANRAIDTSSFDGSFYMQIGSDEGITSGGGVYQIVPGSPATAYTLSVESAAQNWWWPEGEMRIFFMDSSSNILSESVSDLTTAITANAQGLPWNNFTLTATSPPGTAYVKVEFASESYSENYGVEYAGTVFFDNAVLTSAPSSATYIPSVRIMPLGDSITWGQTAPVSSPGGYRLPLYQLLAADGFNAQFVGTVWANGALNLPQENHEGWQGYRIDQIASSFMSWVNSVPSPDVILLLIGTNDYGQGYDTANATNRLDQLIELIATNLPNTKLVVSSVVLRTDNPSINTAIQTTFNPAIPGIVAAHAARGEQVYFANLAAVVGSSDLGTDGLHPNQSGYNKMATNWFNVVTNIITPYGTTNPPVVTHVAVSQSLSNVVLTFSKPVSTSAINSANYTANGGLSVYSATLEPSAQRTVTLVTSPQTPGSPYTLTINNVQDATPGHTAIASGTTVQFHAASVITNAAGTATQLIWSTQPGLATNGLPFSQQPILQTADASGTASTVGVPPSLLVSVAHTAGAGVLSGVTSFDIGTAAGNGDVTFSNLQISTAGAANQLTASIPTMLATSRLANGNFNSPGSVAAPTGWTPWSFGGGYANHEIVSPAPSVLGNYDGTYQMTCGAANTTGGGGCYQFLSAGAGLVYTLSVSSGAQNWWFPSGEIRLFFFDANTNGLATNILSVTTGISAYDVGKPYQQYQFSAVAPAGTTQAKVEFVGYGGGSVWFDNAVLTESNAVLASASAATTPFAVYPAINAAQTNYITGVVNNGDGTFTINFAGVTGGQYYVQTTTNLAPPINWKVLAGSTNSVINPGGTWTCTITNGGSRRFYRSVAVIP
jgi:lysophospholipase L1-like esterase